MTQEQPAVRTAYLTTHYPALSHSFILREVQAVRERGVDVRTFTVRRTPPAEMRTPAMRAENAATPALLGKDVRGWAGSIGRVVRHHPRALAGSVGRALRTGAPTARARLWQLFYLGEAVVMHDRLEREGVHHVHSHHANGAADVARLVADLGNRVDGEGTWSWSFTMHGSTEFENVVAHDLPAKVRDASAVTAITDYARSQLWRHLPPQEWDKISITHMSVDPDVFAPPASREHDGPLRLLNVSRLDGAKGLPLLIDVVAMLRERGVDVELRIVGHGPLHDFLTERIAAAGLADAITLTGPLGEDGVVEQLHWSDVFVSSSFAEGLPVVLMEAMSTQAATVATRIAGVQELIEDGVNGLVVPPGNAEALADAIEALARDPQLRARLGEAGRAAVLDGFTVGAVGPVMAEFLERAAGGSSRGPAAR